MSRGVEQPDVANVEVAEVGAELEQVLQLEVDRRRSFATTALSQPAATRLALDAITTGPDVAAIAERLRVRENPAPAR